MPQSRGIGLKTPGIFSSSPVFLDPSASGTIIRWAFAAEALGNIVGGVGMVFYPEASLALGVARPILDVNRTSITLMQWLGALCFGLTPQLLLGLLNTRTAVESRPMVYWTLLAGEGFLIPTFLWQATKAGDNGLTPKALAVCTSVLVVPAIWRLWVLLVKPDWMGRYSEQKVGKTN